MTTYKNLASVELLLQGNGSVIVAAISLHGRSLHTALLQPSAEFCLITAVWGPSQILSIMFLCYFDMPFKEGSVAINIDVLQHRSAYSHYLSGPNVLSSSLNGQEETQLREIDTLQERSFLQRPEGPGWRPHRWMPV